MAGKSKRTLYFLILVFLLSVGVLAPTHAETVRGESRDLGIRFVVQGGSHWCASQIKVRLTAASSTSFQPDAIAFLQMIGRVRAVVLSQCPAIETIVFDGVTKESVVFAAETSRLTRWRRLISLDPATHRPKCAANDDMNCPAKIDAYLLAHTLMRSNVFADTELTSVLQLDSHDLAFRSRDVVGKLRMTPRAELAQEFQTPGQFADAIIANISDSCTKQGSVAETTTAMDHGSDLVVRGTTCRPANGPAAQNVVLVWASQEQFRVFSLWAEDPSRAEAIGFGDNLVKTIKNAR